MFAFEGRDKKAVVKAHRMALDREVVYLTDEPTIDRCSNEISTLYPLCIEAFKQDKVPFLLQTGV